MTDIASPLPVLTPAIPSPGRPGRITRLWRKTSLGMKICLSSFAGVILLALFAPWIAPYDPNAQALLSRLLPPVGFAGANPAHPLGTDQLGRDLLSRTLYGLRLTLGIALIGSFISLILGTVLGTIAGYIRGRIGAVIMGAVDVQIAVPFTLIALLVIALLGNSLPVLICVIGLTGWESYTRIVRAQVLTVSRLPFIEAAIAAGAPRGRILVRNVLPNIASPIVVVWTMTFSALILTESSLSFLGLGVQPPTATLGSMVGLGRDFLASTPWIAIVPSLAIMLVSLQVLLIGDWLRDALDVRLK
ncbi:ABC transporter permease [Arsenicitalea aurantiaca]|uniref:ABC transporter permease n=1 Tax=Arsenicitalea aurantiaca TaxID=1783274 RepID=A0A433XAQ4_9HYPH|nr:ABC transporter permease [Arsenicitalea aurantiaca]RUT31088.1 ABC transporter permease [Arsenicitalea aurantiaca]